MTERGDRRLGEILRERAGEAASGPADPWPEVRERVAGRFGERVFIGPSPGATAGQRRPWPRRIVPRTRAVWVLAALAAVLFGTAAYAASTMTVSDVTVEEAVLQNAPGPDRIVVRVRATGGAENPWCRVTHGSSLQDGRWLDGDLTEQRVFGDERVFTFFEDETPPGDPVDPQRTPFFAACSADTGSAGVRYDDAHVAGTAEGGPPWPTEDREFVRKAMDDRRITPPVSTLSSGSTTVEGEFGTYCWSPGKRDEDEDALWCWDEQQNMGIPGEDKALAVVPGSVLRFDFGGEVRPDHFDAGAFPISYGRLTGAAPTDLRVEDGGRIPIPRDTRPGEYAVGVFVSGSQGEADYSFRIDVEREGDAGP